MIDTLTRLYPLGGNLSPDAQAIIDGRRHDPLPGWLNGSRANHDDDGNISRSRYFAHNATGLRVIPLSTGAVTVEVSAPRMLRPDNTQLLQTDGELAHALQQAATIAAEIVDLRTTGAYLNRVDITVYVPVPPYRLLPLFNLRKHPRIQKLPAYYPFESLTWAGAKQSLCVYDKAAEKKMGNDKRTRVELRLRNPKLAELFGLVDGQRLHVGDLSLAKAYRILREFLLEFRTIPAAQKYSPDLLLAHAVSEGLRAPDGRHLLDWRTECLAPEVARRVRRQIEGLSLTCSGFDWGNYLPENPTPEQIHGLTWWRPPARPGDSEEPIPTTPPVGPATVPVVPAPVVSAA